MNVSDFQSKIVEWRTAADLSQAGLDEACGFLPGTVGRLERGILKLKEEQLVRIVRWTKRDLLWTLLESCGVLYRSLLPLEEELDRHSKSSFAAQTIWQDEDFKNALAGLLTGAEVVLTKVAKAAEPKPWISDLLLRAADRAALDGQRRRVRKRRGKGESPAGA
jgi:transcriptional regulator with XRE-family HTH domain